MRIPFEGAGLLLIRPWQSGGGDDNHQQWEILLGRRKYGVDRGFWSIPGGGKKRGESFAQCALRETEEEMRIDLRPVCAGEEPDLIWSVAVADAFVWETYVLDVGPAAAALGSDDAFARFGTESLSDEFSEVGWFALAKPPRPLHPLLRPVLRRLRAKLKRKKPTS